MMDGLKAIVEQLQNQESKIDINHEYLRDFLYNQKGNYNQAFKIFTDFKTNDANSKLINIYEIKLAELKPNKLKSNNDNVIKNNTKDNKNTILDKKCI